MVWTSAIVDSIGSELVKASYFTSSTFLPKLKQRALTAFSTCMCTYVYTNLPAHQYNGRKMYSVYETAPRAALS